MQTDAIHTDAILIDGPELARLTSTSVSTIHAMRRAGKLPLKIIRLARCVRFERREVERWIAAGCPAESKWRAMNLDTRNG